MKPTLKSKTQSAVKLLVAMSIAWSPSYGYGDNDRGEAAAKVDKEAAAEARRAARAVQIRDEMRKDAQTECEELRKISNEVTEIFNKACDDASAEQGLLLSSSKEKVAANTAQARGAPGRESIAQASGATVAASRRRDCGAQIARCINATTDTTIANDNSSGGFVQDVLSQTTKQVFNVDINGTTRRYDGTDSNCGQATEESSVQSDINQDMKDLAKITEDLAKLQAEKQEADKQAKKEFDETIKRIKADKLKLSDEKRKKLEGYARQQDENRQSISTIMDQISELDGKAIESDKTYADNLLKTSPAAVKASCQAQVKESIAKAKAASSNQGSTGNLISNGTATKDLINFQGQACIKQFETQRDALIRAYETGRQAIANKRSAAADRLQALQDEQSRSSTFLQEMQTEDAARLTDLAQEAIDAQRKSVQDQNDAQSNMIAQQQALQQKRIAIEESLRNNKNTLDGKRKKQTSAAGNKIWVGANKMIEAKGRLEQLNSKEDIPVLDSEGNQIAKEKYKCTVEIPGTKEDYEKMKEDVRSQGGANQ